MSEIKEGDLVELKSGGPRMTVARIMDTEETGEKEKTANCNWFNDKDVPQNASFPLSNLKFIRKG